MQPRLRPKQGVEELKYEQRREKGDSRQQICVVIEAIAVEGRNAALEKIGFGNANRSLHKGRINAAAPMIAASTHSVGLEKM